MSKYTTEVRYICETEAGLEESKGYNDVNEIISLARTKIFNFSYPIYDENYRSVLETKILKHFYTREIGLETVGLWKLKLDTKMNEIMPYYNQLYKSALLEFNPLWTDDYSRIYNRANDGNNLNVGNNETDSTSFNVGQNEETTSETNTRIGQNDEKRTDNNVSRDKYADTPQGALTDLEADKYLTNARKITEDNSGTTANTNIENGTTDNNRNISSVNNSDSKTNTNSSNQNIFTNVEDYLEMVQGRRGKDSSELLLKYRKTFLNIDMQVIDDLEELFYHLW